MKRTKKQGELFDAYKSGKYSTYILAGGTGSAKTMGVFILMNAICELCPNLRIAIFRKSEKVLKNNTIPSFKKMLELLGKRQKVKNMKIKYNTGSEILFLWADISKDPDCDNMKGMELTGVVFDEINQIDEKYLNIAKTRVGRWNNFEQKNKKYSIKPFIIGTCNPTNNWVKTQFYDKYRDGILSDNVFFQLSLPVDNPFLSKDYLDSLNDLPEEEYNRYVLGDWNYNDDTNSLIKYEWIKECITDKEYAYDDSTLECLGIDVARYGDDRTVFSNVQDTFFYDFKEFKKQDTVQTSERAKIMMDEKNIGGERVAVDVIGIGAGVVDNLINNGYSVYPYNSANKPKNAIPFYDFKNFRAEVFWRIREKIKKGELQICNNTKLIKELTNIRYIIKDKTISIEGKEEMKKRLGYSPDYADAFSIAFYISQMQNINSLDISEEMKQTIGGNIMNTNF